MKKYDVNYNKRYVIDIYGQKKIRQDGPLCYVFGTADSAILYGSLKPTVGDMVTIYNGKTLIAKKSWIDDGNGGLKLTEWKEYEEKPFIPNRKQYITIKRSTFDRLQHKQTIEVFNKDSNGNIPNDYVKILVKGVLSVGDKSADIDVVSNEDYCFITIQKRAIIKMEDYMEA